METTGLPRAEVQDPAQLLGSQTPWPRDCPFLPVATPWASAASTASAHVLLPDPAPAQSPSLPVLSTSTCMLTIQTHFSGVSAPQVTSSEAQPHSLPLCHSHDPSVSPAFQNPTPRTSPPPGRGYHSPVGRAPRACGPVSATGAACGSLSDLLSGPLFQPL